MKKRLFLTMLLSVFLMTSAENALAEGWSNSDLLVTPDFVKAKLEDPNWVVIDARDLKDYADGHIPGAISLGKRLKKALRDSTARVWNDIAKYENLFAKAGIGNDTHVIIYHGDIKTLTDASVGFWVLEYLGQKDKVHLLDGGLDAWRNAGNRLSKEPTVKEATTFTAKVNSSLLASTDEIVNIAKGNQTDAQLIDSRSKKEHVGKDMRALRGGHVPNTTINVSHLNTLKKEFDKKADKDKEIGYLDMAATIKAFEGLDKSKRTIGYCQTGTRSTLTYMQLRLMGFENAANWDESWRVYASDFNNYPVEAPNGAQVYNFDGVNKKLKKLEKELKKLKEKLEKEET